MQISYYNETSLWTCCRHHTFSSMPSMEKGYLIVSYSIHECNVCWIFLGFQYQHAFCYLATKALWNFNNTNTLNLKLKSLTPFFPCPFPHLFFHIFPAPFSFSSLSSHINVHIYFYLTLLIAVLCDNSFST